MKNRKIIILLPLSFSLVACGTNHEKELTREEGLTKAKEIQMAVEEDSFVLPKTCHSSYSYKTVESSTSENQEQTTVSLKKDFFYDHDEKNPYCHWFSIVDDSKKINEGWIYVYDGKGYSVSIDIDENKTYREIAFSDVVTSITNVLKSEDVDSDSVKTMSAQRINKIADELNHENTSMKTFIKDDGTFKTSFIQDVEGYRTEMETEFKQNLITRVATKEEFTMSLSSSLPSFTYNSSLEMTFDWEKEIQHDCPNLEEFSKLLP